LLLVLSCHVTCAMETHFFKSDSDGALPPSLCTPSRASYAVLSFFPPFHFYIRSQGDVLETVASRSKTSSFFPEYRFFLFQYNWPRAFIFFSFTISEYRLSVPPLLGMSWWHLWPEFKPPFYRVMFMGLFLVGRSGFIPGLPCLVQDCKDVLNLFPLPHPVKHDPPEIALLPVFLFALVVSSPFPSVAPTNQPPPFSNFQLYRPAFRPDRPRHAFSLFILKGRECSASPDACQSFFSLFPPGIPLTNFTMQIRICKPSSHPPACGPHRSGLRLRQPFYPVPLYHMGVHQIMCLSRLYTDQF